MVVVVSVVSAFWLAAVVIILVCWEIDRRMNRAREEELINHIMARDLREYAQLKERLSTTPRDKIRLTELENELAAHAAELQRGMGVEADMGAEAGTEANMGAAKLGWPV